MEHEDEGQGSTALTRFTVLAVQCFAVGVVAAIVMGIMLYIVRVGR